MIGIAVIPTIFESPYLDALCDRLASEDVRLLTVCNNPECPADTSWNADRHWSALCRPGWGIYRTWNFGLRLGAHLNVPTLILNDDIRLYPGGPTEICRRLAGGDGQGWAILGFDYTNDDITHSSFAVPVSGTYRHGGIGGFAFGVNPRLCARVDRRFKWWGGDDDLVNSTLAMGRKVGLCLGPYTHVDHPEPSLTARAHPELLPEGWLEHDRALLAEKWGDPY